MSNQNTETVPQGLPMRLVKLLISGAVFLVSSGVDAFRKLAGMPRDGECIILYYHAIAPEHRARFARQLDHLLRYARPVRIDSTTPLERGARYAAVTFDDGYESVAAQALPELKSRGIPATVFVASDLTGKKPGWPGYPERCMSFDQLRALPVDLITMGSHTKTHPFLPDINEQEARQELAGSKVKLEQMIGRPVTLFSFPYGGFNDRLVGWCREAGYARVFTTLPRITRLEPEEFISGRFVAEPTDWAIEFHLKLIGAYRWLPWAFAAKRKTKAFFPSIFAPVRAGAVSGPPLSRR